MKPEGYVHGMTDKPAATVTLSRAVLLLLACRDELAEWCDRHAEDYGMKCQTERLLVDIEALLRAAERQK